MFRIQVNNFEKKDLVRELIDEFISKSQYEIYDVFTDEDTESFNHSDIRIVVNKCGKNDLNEIKRELYLSLSEYIENVPDWGILTGVRPVKLAGELTESIGRESADAVLEKEYLISKSKRKLILDIYDYQTRTFGKANVRSASLYIGIPFCPTRCSYCAFASNQEEYSEIERYLEALNLEIDFVSKEMHEKNIVPESLYIGGGTPTVLSAKDLDSLMKHISKGFNLSELKEYTVEAGRPDTIDKEKLTVIKNNGAERISINPQSMNEKTMAEIGRAHSPDDIDRAFEEAREIGFKFINMDLIAGLPGESERDFVNSLIHVLNMHPENITVHSLAVKRASRLKEEDPEFFRSRSNQVRTMVKLAFDNLVSREYKPYYLYRQKHMAGACENIGYTLKGCEGLYNIRIMDEHQTNIALGAGGISKVYYPKENRLERVANVTNYREYISRIDEMIDRKKEGIFNAYNSTEGN